MPCNRIVSREGDVGHRGVVRVADDRADHHTAVNRGVSHSKIANLRAGRTPEQAKRVPFRLFDRQPGHGVPAAVESPGEGACGAGNFGLLAFAALRRECPDRRPRAAAEVDIRAQAVMRRQILRNHFQLLARLNQIRAFGGAVAPGERLKLRGSQGVEEGGVVDDAVTVRSIVALRAGVHAGRLEQCPELRRGDVGVVLLRRDGHCRDHRRRVGGAACQLTAPAHAQI